MSDDNIKFNINKFIKPKKYFEKWEKDLYKEIKTQSKEVESLTNCLYDAKRIFICGRGRSELTAKKCFMRLKQTGKWELYAIGETFTPPIEEGNKDVLFCVSGSGKTNYVVTAAETGKKEGAVIATLTSKPETSLGKSSDFLIKIKGRTKDVPDYEVAQIKKDLEPIGYYGSEFEHKADKCMELIINWLIKRKGIAEDKMLHNNVE